MMEKALLQLHHRRTAVRGQFIGESAPSTPHSSKRQLADGVEIGNLSIGCDECVAKAGRTHHVVPTLTVHALEVREGLFDDLCRRIGAYGCTGSPISEY